MSASLHTHEQASAHSSPWKLRELVRIQLWQWSWTLLCAWTPKPLNRWRLFVLRRWGAQLHGVPWIHPRARIHIPWNLTMHHRAVVGDRANLYTLGKIEIGARTTVAQEVYLCGGTHDFNDPTFPLQTAPIRIGEDAFVCLRAIVLPGVEIGARAVVGAGSVVTRDVPSDVIAAGNPCRVIRARQPASAASGNALAGA